MKLSSDVNITKELLMPYKVNRPVIIKGTGSNEKPTKLFVHRDVVASGLLKVTKGYVLFEALDMRIYGGEEGEDESL